MIAGGERQDQVRFAVRNARDDVRRLEAERETAADEVGARAAAVYLGAGMPAEVAEVEAELAEVEAKLARARAALGYLA